jgi:hypothetical protein
VCLLVTSSTLKLPFPQCQRPRCGIVGWGTALQAKRSRVRFPSLSFLSRFSRGVGLTTLALSCTDCLKIWDPQTPGTIRACPGIALLFFYPHDKEIIRLTECINLYLCMNIYDDCHLLSYRTILQCNRPGFTLKQYYWVFVFSKHLLPRSVGNKLL